MLILLVAGTLAIVVGGHVASNDLLYSPWTSLAGIAAYIALIGGSIWAAMSAGGYRALGIRWPERPGRAFALAAGVLVAGLVASAALEPVLHGARSQGLTPRRFPGGAEASVGIAITALVLVLIGPFAEELFFRGVLTGAFWARLGSFTPLVSGAIFGAAHLEPRAFPALFILGALLGWLYIRTRSVWPGVAVHAANNLLALIAALLAH
ncbi:MAG: type II CAAX endopeptidase family protein [Gaiellales bacterium]